MPLEPNRRYEEAIDISYITYDCFHFSQKGHALGMLLTIDTVINNRRFRLISGAMTFVHTDAIQ